MLVTLEAVPGYADEGAQLRDLYLDGQIWVITIWGQWVGACQRPLIPLIELDRTLVHGSDNLDIAAVLIHELYHYNNPWNKERHAVVAGEAWTIAFWNWHTGGQALPDASSAETHLRP